MVIGIYFSFLFAGYTNRNTIKK